MRANNQLNNIIEEWLLGEEKNSLDLGNISNEFAPFKLDSNTLSSCLWEILRDGKIPSCESDPELRATIVEPLYSSSLTGRTAQTLALRGGGVEWEGDDIDEMLFESALYKPKQNHDEVNTGIKTLLLGPNMPTESSTGRNSKIEIIIPASPPKKLRDYQKEVINLALAKLDEEGKCNIVLPTGTGKTFCAIEVIVSLLCSKKVDEVIWCTNRRDLLEQVHRDIRKRWSTWKEGFTLPTLTVVKNEADKPETFNPPVILFRTLQNEHKSSREVNCRRLLVVDESHRHLDQSEKLAKETLLFEGFVMGLTATINDEWKRMLDIFGSPVIPSSVKFSPGHQLDNSDFEKAGILAKTVEHIGTPNEGALLSEVTKDKLLEKMLEIVIGRIEELGIQKSLVFVEEVKAAKLLAGRLDGKGIAATHVSGKTHPRVRESIIRGIESGQFRVIVNADLWKEGIDIPSIDSVFILKNTPSNSVTAQQMIGRALRGPEAEGTSKAHIIWGY